MSISSVSLALPIVSSGGLTPITNAASLDASAPATLATAPADTVTLSQGAQQFLSAAMVAPPDDSSQPDAVTKAIFVLNNTDGSVSVDDQLQAYDLTANFVKGPVTGTSNAYDPSKADAIVALLDSPFAQHVQQVLNQVDAPKEMWATFTNGNQPANALNRSLATFNALSATNQQIYISANNSRLQMLGGTAVSVDDYRAKQTAQANVDRALQAVMSEPAYATALSKTTNAVSAQIMGLPQNFGNRITDLGVLATAAGDQATITLVKLVQGNGGTGDWTQQTQAYFAANGPPPAAVPTASNVDGYSGSFYGFGGMSNAYGNNQVPAGYQAPDGKTLVAALAATWDTTGKISVTARTAAEQTLEENFLFRQNIYSPASMAVASIGTSPFENQRAAAASNFFWSQGVQSAVSGNTDTQPSQTELGLLNALPLEQQQFVFAGAGVNVPNRNYEGYNMVYDATLDDWKTRLAQQAATIHAGYLADQASASAATAASTTPSASASTAASIASSVATASAAAKALAALISPKSTFSNAEVALVLMQNAAKATATAKAADPKSTSSATVWSIKSSTAEIAATTKQQAAYKMGGTVSVTA